ENLGVADQVLLFLYLFFGVTLVACLFVHLALSFSNTSLSFRQTTASYFSVLITLLVIVLMMSGVLNEEGLAIVLIIGSIYGFVGGMIFIYRLWFGNAVTIGRGLSLYVTMALVLGWLPNMLVQYGMVALGELGGLANLSLVLTLAALHWLSRQTA
ncbi:MAG: hypothetical protein MI746_09160, partial [Pseudomonadales bacterium]|nr:hypothetical protein [Pseudomonadales bacterium]